MTSASQSLDDLAQLCATLASDEVCEILNEVYMDDLTACEMVAFLTVLRPVRERRAAAQRQPAPVLELVRSGKRGRR
jgi:hypothetical protein